MPWPPPRPAVPLSHCTKSPALQSRERNKNRTSILSYHVTPQKAERKGEKRSSAQHCAHSNNHVTAINEWVLIPFNKIKKKHDKTWYTITDRARLNAQAWSFGAPPIRSWKKNAFKKTTCRDRIAYRIILPLLGARSRGTGTSTLFSSCLAMIARSIF